MAAGGSYLYELRQWADSVALLHRACARSGGNCSSLLAYFRNHPGEDATHTGSQVFDEIKNACQVGKSRAPVPNDSPVWCDENGVCEQPSCRKWWAEHIPAVKNPRPWHDNRSEYDALKDTCGWVENTPPTTAELNRIQRQLKEDANQIKGQFCAPKWVDGYCGAQEDTADTSKSDFNSTRAWKELFEEAPITVSSSAALLSAAVLPVAHLRRVSHERLRCFL